MTRSIFKNTAKLINSQRTGNTEEDSSALVIETQSLIQAIVNDADSERDGRITAAIEKFTEARMYCHFFSCGVLPEPSLVQPCNDDEYIGATFGFAQELSRYVVGRACENDLHSIAICRDLVMQLNEKALEFDFRNGHLRRKYDGLKYVIKTIEDITYELSLVQDIPIATISAR